MSWFDKISDRELAANFRAVVLKQSTATTGLWFKVVRRRFSRPDLVCGCHSTYDSAKHQAEKLGWGHEVEGVQDVPELQQEKQG